MKKTVIIVVSVLLCAVCATVIGQKKILSPKEERREVREKRRAERIADFEKTMDSVILSRNFQFNPQTMQRQPAALGIFFPKVGLAGDTLAIIMTLGTLSFLVTTPEVWVPDLGSGEFGFPLLSGAGRLVIKDIVILASAVVLLSDSSQRVLKTLKKD